MDIHANIPLKNYLTMRLGGNARFMADARTPEEVAQLYSNAKKENIDIVILGGGSNTLANDTGFNGLVIRNMILGVEVLNDDATSTTFRCGAGESWDEFVKMTVERNLVGIEALSAIPGTIGAAPVQNIGAYGQEIADTFVELNAYDTQTGQFVTLNAEQCHFSYRDSIFRSEAAHRYAIVSVTFRLYKSSPTPPFYAALQSYLDDHKITLYTSQIIRDAVIAIRSEKLPNPEHYPNTGSFFKNAVIEKWQLDDLLHEYPDMPHFELDGKNYKVPTGWLIEQAGLKGQLFYGMRVNPKNALVLINESAKSYRDLALARKKIIDTVRDTFRITIKQEPLEL